MGMRKVSNTAGLRFSIIVAGYSIKQVLSFNVSALYVGVVWVNYSLYF